jgi:hypothetical protein
MHLLGLKPVPNWLSMRFGDSLPEQWDWSPPVIENDATEVPPGMYRCGAGVLAAMYLGGQTRLQPLGQPANRTALAFAQAIVFGMFGLTIKERLSVRGLVEVKF